jgi:hypothetical protein
VKELSMDEKSGTPKTGDRGADDDGSTAPVRPCPSTLPTLRSVSCVSCGCLPIFERIGAAVASAAAWSLRCCGEQRVWVWALT